MLQKFIQNLIENKCFKLKKITHNDYEEDCFICFMPYEKHNPIKMLSKFSHITQKCKCDARIHLVCLNNWIQQKQSCPICRTKYIYLETPNLRKTYTYVVCIINIYVFIILIYHIYLILFIFPHILFQIYLSIKL